MAYVQYATDGVTITGLFSCAQPFQTTHLADNDPTVVAFIASQAPPTVPQSVSDRQFFQAAAQLGIISQADALAMMSTGVIPSALLTAIGTLPPAAQFDAKMKIIANRTFQRNDPLGVALSAAMGQTPAQVDALFTLANSL